MAKRLTIGVSAKEKSALANAITAYFNIGSKAMSYSHFCRFELRYSTP